MIFAVRHMERISRTLKDDWRFQKLEVTTKYLQAKEEVIFALPVYLRQAPMWLVSLVLMLSLWCNDPAVLVCLWSTWFLSAWLPFLVIWLVWLLMIVEWMLLVITYDAGLVTLLLLMINVWSSSVLLMLSVTSSVSQVTDLSSYLAMVIVLGWCWLICCCHWLQC